VIVLAVDSALGLGAIALPSLGGLASLGTIAALVMFVVWFFRARINAEGHGWRQRWSPGWAIGGWLVPVVNLWFPFQIMVDIWQAGRPDEARANRPILPGLWWTCYVPFFLLNTFSPGNPTWYIDLSIKITGVLTAITAALLVRKVSNGPLGE
jgi:hypothetical protein